MIESTHSVHYEHYRAQFLSSQGRSEAFLPADKDYEEKVAAEHAKIQAHFKKEQEKLEANMAKKLKEKEAEFAKKEEELVALRASLIAEIDDGNRKIAAERADLDKLTADLAPEGESSKKKGLLASSSMLGRSKK